MDRGPWWAFKLWCWINRCESWTIKKTDCWRTDAFKLWCWRKLLRVPWTAGRSNPSILEENNTEYSLEGLPESEAEAPILWPPDVKSQLTRKDPNAGKDWRQEKWATEDVMVGWHHRLNGPGSEQTPGDGTRLNTHAHTHSIFIECLLCARHYSNYEKGTSKIEPYKGYIVTCSDAHSCPALCNPMDCSLPGFSVHGIFPCKKTRVGCHFLLKDLTDWKNGWIS